MSTFLPGVTLSLLQKLPESNQNEAMPQAPSCIFTHPTNQALPAVQRHGVWSAHAPMRIGRRGHTPEWRWLLNPTRLGWAKLDDPGRQEQAERGAVRRFSHRWPEETSTKNCMWDPKCKPFLMSRCQRQSLQWKNAQQNAQINLIFLFFYILVSLFYNFIIFINNIVLYIAHIFLFSDDWWWVRSGDDDWWSLITDGEWRVVIPCK